ncbi:MAG: TSUP family transporter [Anaerolineae bacterium]|nr:TSUP family transporter [Anaerolineae bacterium]
MYLTIHNLFWLLLTGSAVGVLGAILGIGGGVFLVPALVLIFRIPVHHAVATSIVSVIATSSAATSTNIEKGLVNMRLGITLEIATALGAMSGALTAEWLSETTLLRIFAVVLLVVAVLLGWKSSRGERAAILSSQHTILDDQPDDLGLLGASFYDLAEGRQISYRVWKVPLGFLVSLVAGNLSGLLGVGGGFIKVPVIHLVCGVPMKAATATSNFMIGVTAAASAFIYFGRGQVRPALTTAVILGVLVGSFIGAVISQRLPGRLVQAIFAVFLLPVAWQMFVQAGL